MKIFLPTIKKTGGTFRAIFLLAFLTTLTSNVQSEETHGGDIELQVTGGQMVTNHRVYAAELGEIIPNEVDEPGFDNLAGTFLAGSTIRFSIRDALRKWNGIDFQTIPDETMSITFGTSLGPVVTTQEPSVTTGFELAVSGDGAWHRHYDFTLNAPARTGIYLLQLQLKSSDLQIAATDPFSIVFNQNDSELNHDAAIEFAELQVAGGLPGDFNLNEIVDAADYTLWQDYLGTEIAVLNGNGLDGPTVSRADYLLWKNQFVASQPDWTAAIAVPEPTQLPLVLVAAGLLPWRVRIQQTRTPLRSSF